jgi:uncharacterized protein DUF3592
MGLIVDVIVAYVIKLILRTVRRWQSRNWPLVMGRIDRSVVGGGWVFNCPTVEVAYTYDFKRQTYSAIDRKPFLSDKLATLDAGDFKVGAMAKVRVNPVRPQQSFIPRSWAR